MLQWSFMSQNFFTSAVGSYILRGDNPIYIKNYEMAMALFNLQDDKYKFRPVPISTGAICLSCEG